VSVFNPAGTLGALDGSSRRKTRAPRQDGGAGGAGGEARSRLRRQAQRAREGARRDRRGARTGSPDRIAGTGKVPAAKDGGRGARGSGRSPPLLPECG